MNEQEDHPIYKFYYEGLKFCGCGDSEDTLTFIRDVLRSIKNKFDDDAPGTFKEKRDIENALLPLDGSLALFFRYWMDMQGWTEHGGSVYGAWLTNEGENVLTLLESSDIEEAMKDPWERTDKI